MRTCAGEDHVFVEMNKTRGDRSTMQSKFNDFREMEPDVLAKSNRNLNCWKQAVFHDSTCMISRNQASKKKRACVYRLSSSCTMWSRSSSASCIIALLYARVPAESAGSDGRVVLWTSRYTCMQFEKDRRGGIRRWRGID